MGGDWDWGFLSEEGRRFVLKALWLVFSQRLFNFPGGLARRFVGFVHGSFLCFLHVCGFRCVVTTSEGRRIWSHVILSGACLGQGVGEGVRYDIQHGNHIILGLSPSELEGSPNCLLMYPIIGCCVLPI